jgi:hypothetical protein
MKVLKITFLFILLFTLFSCKKTNSDCFDPLVYEQYKNAICTLDCPGVTGCDGKRYCNECNALSHGIKLK